MQAPQQAARSAVHARFKPCNVVLSLGWSPRQSRPTSTRAQNSLGLRRLGFWSRPTPSPTGTYFLREGLRDLGYVDGQGISLITARPKATSIASRTCRGTRSLDVDILVVWQTPAASRHDAPRPQFRS